ncbi:MAG: 3'(2'),5'-bisphosphate nucleotidase, partial [Bacteroidetes bacterium RIFCSPHIGHO2_02_FULL_44_7]
MEEYLHIALQAALDAGREIISIYESGDFDVDFKADHSPLTRADLASHNVISRHLLKTGIPLLSEEGKHLPYSERKNWTRLWIVDPIDGTKEFIKKNGDFTVNIALIDNSIPVLGVIYVPVHSEMYYSTNEQGAFKAVCPLDTEVTEILARGEKLPFAKSDRPYTVVASLSHMSPETENYINELKVEHGQIESISRGSSLKLCMVAEGSADCYPRFAPTMEWDTAAGQAICMHAGFDVIDWETQQTMRYNRENLLNNWFTVSP